MTRLRRLSRTVATVRRSGYPRAGDCFQAVRCVEPVRSGLCLVATSAREVVPLLTARPPSHRDCPSAEQAVGLRMVSWGTGHPALLLHGALLGGRPTWSPLRGLSAGWRLLVPNRRGYQPGPRADVECQQCDVRDAAALLSELDEPAHVIGHSRGAVVALAVARRCPELVRSLVLLEPPPLDAADAVSGQVRQWRAALAELDVRFPRDEDLLAAFFQLVGADDPVPEPLPDVVRAHVALLRRSPPPWVDDDLLADGPLECPVMVVSGGTPKSSRALQICSRACLVLAGRGSWAVATFSPRILRRRR